MFNFILFTWVGWLIIQGQHMDVSAKKADPISSVALPGAQWRNDGTSRRIVQFDASHHNQGFVSNTGSSTACFRTSPH